MKEDFKRNELEKYFLFCLLSRAQSYEKVCAAYDWVLVYLWDGSIKSLGKYSEFQISKVLKKSGYRFPNQTAKHIKDNTWVDGLWLKVCTREEMVRECKGIGMKLASMFLVRMRGAKYAIIDVHINRWLENIGIQNVEKMSYEDKEKIFLSVANKLKISPEELDYEIWNQYRIGNKKRRLYT